MRRFLWTAMVVLGSLGLTGCGGRDARPSASADAVPAAKATPRASVVHDSASAPTPPTLTPEYREPSAKPAETSMASGDDGPTSVPDGERHSPPPAGQSRPAAGILTAGSFDDHERFTDFREFLSGSMQNDRTEALPRVHLGQRVVIRVATGEGKPVPDARVVIRRTDPARGQADSPTLLDVTTGSDGRTLFLSGMDGAPSKEPLQVSVTPPGGGEPLVQTMSTEQPIWEIRLPSAKPASPQQLDLALVIDTTGSMGDELEYLKVEIDNIATSIHRMFPNVDQRFALIVYRDQGDEYVVRSFDFTAALPEFRRTLSQQRAAGGGDYPEAVHLALEQAGKLSWRGEGTARVLFWVADAPPHREFAARTLQHVSALRQRTVRMFPVAGSGTAREAEFVMRTAAFLTQGQYLFLTDHSGVGNPHETPHVPDYVVERLNRLMIRMIASELAGRKLAADEIIAIEGGRSPYDPSTPIPPNQQQTRNEAVSFPTPSTPTASWSSLFSLGGWKPWWGLLAVAILVGKVVFDEFSERRRR